MGNDDALFSLCRAAAERARPAGSRVLSTLPDEERARIVREALDRLGTTFGPCREYLLALAGGMSIDALARHTRVAPDVLCGRISRCRERVRALLARDGYVP